MYEPLYIHKTVVIRKGKPGAAKAQWREGEKRADYFLGEK